MENFLILVDLLFATYLAWNGKYTKATFFVTIAIFTKVI
jgi:hypothetical protein